MNIQPNIPALEAILVPWQALIGAEYQGYRNHVYRMVHFCFALKPCTAEEQEKIIIAAAFHDIGIWIDNTVDYIPPSLPPAKAYLEAEGKQAWSDEVRLMISEHHKLRQYTDQHYPLVELFRRGDLVDFSFGMVKFGLPAATIQAVKQAFPNADFHKSLAKRAAKWFVKHPLNPAPMMKW